MNNIKLFNWSSWAVTARPDVQIKSFWSDWILTLYLCNTTFFSTVSNIFSKPASTSTPRGYRVHELRTLLWTFEGQKICILCLPQWLVAYYQDYLPPPQCQYTAISYAGHSQKSHRNIFSAIPQKVTKPRCPWLNITTLTSPSGGPRSPVLPSSLVMYERAFDFVFIRYHDVCIISGPLWGCES